MSSALIDGLGVAHVVRLCDPAFVDPGTPEALAQRNRTETAKWERAIREAKIEAQ